MDEYTDCKLLCSDYEPFVTGEQAPVPPKSVLKRMPNNGSIEKIQLSKENIYIGALGCCMCMRKEFREWMQPYWFPGWHRMINVEISTMCRWVLFTALKFGKASLTWK